MGIRTKLVFCLLAVIIPLGAVSTFALHLFDKQLEARTENALASTLRLEALRINEILEGYAQDARNLAAEPLIRNSVAAANTYRLNSESSQSLSTQLEDQETIAPIDYKATWPLQLLAMDLRRRAGMSGSAAAELRLIDRQGATLGETMGFSWNTNAPSITQRAMSSASTLFDRAFQTDTGRQHIAIVTPIVGVHGEVAGAIIVEVPLGPITSVVSMHEKTGKTTEAYIAQVTDTGDTQLITALRFNRAAAFNKIIPAAADLPISQAMTAAATKVITSKDYRGVETVAALQRIPATHWGVVVKIDTSEAYAPIDGLRQSLGIAAAISLLLILAGCTLCLAPVAQRLKKTAHTAHRMMQGDLTVRASDTHSDEIGNLARTIDSLARQLEQDHLKRLDVEEQLRHQATHDELTGLLNRKHAKKLIEELNNQSTQVHSVMFLDLNGFKDVNDFYGHAAGDEVLISVAQRLINAIPNSATLARWGGDEFVVILPNTDAVAAHVFTMDVHAAFEDPITTSEGIHNISTSIGLATSNRSKTLQETLAEADALMYEDKKQRQSNRSINTIAERTLERALQEERIEIGYEPIVSRDAAGNEVLVAADAQIRIRTREGGIILSDELLPQINDSRLKFNLYNYVLDTCTKSIDRWINAHIVSPQFKLLFEIDPCVWQNVGVKEQLLSRIQSPNIALTSKHLSDTPLPEDVHTDVIKVPVELLHDEIFTARLMADYTARGITVCINGVDTRQQLNKLTSIGNAYHQGRLFDTPLRAVDFVSRWGQPSMGRHIPLSDRDFRLRLAS